MKLKRILLAFVLFTAMLPTAFAYDAKPVTAAELAWLAGVWRAEIWGGVGEEIWVKNSDTS